MRRILLPLAVVAGLLAGCDDTSLGPRLFPLSPDQPVVMPRTAVSVAEALELAHRQTGLRWAAAGDLAEPPGADSVGPFEVGQKVFLNRLLDRIADALGTRWRWRRQVAVFGPIDDARVSRIAARLTTGDASHRRRAAAELADGLWPESVGPLLSAAFGDDDPAVRWAALVAIERLKSGCRTRMPTSRLPLLAIFPEEASRTIQLPAGGVARRAGVAAAAAAGIQSAGPAILAAFESMPPEDRARVAWALSRLPDSRAAGVLADLAADVSMPDDLRSQAAWSLGVMQSPQAVGQLLWLSRRGDDLSRILAAEGLARSRADGAVSRLASMTGDDSDAVAVSAADALGAIGSEAACRSLGRLLDDDDPARRRLAAMGLGRATQPVAVELLLSAAEDADASVRAAVADALGWAGGHRAQARLRDMIADPSGGVRAAAALALARVGGAENVLDSWLADARLSADIKLAIVIGLGQSHSPRAVPLVARVVRGESFTPLRQQAVIALARIGGEAGRAELLALAGRYGQSLPLTVRALGWARHLGAVNELTRNISAGGRMSRAYAVAALGDLPSGPALGSLLRLGQAGDPLANRFMFDAAAGSRAPRTLAMLAERARSHNPASAMLAAAALSATWGDPRATDALLEAARGASPRGRQVAVAALSAGGDPAAIGPLITLARDDADLGVATRAVRALRSGAFGPSRQIDELMHDLAGGPRDFGVPASPGPVADQPANSWRLRAWARGVEDAAVPPISYESAMAFDRESGRVIQIGGHGRRVDGPAVAGAWAFDAESSRWVQQDLANPPPATGGARELAIAAGQAAHVRWAAGRRGWQLRRRSDLVASSPWMLDLPGRRWIAPQPDGGPGPRGWTQVVHDSDRGLFILFSGLTTTDGQAAVDTWAYDPHANRWDRIETAGPTPGPRGGAACAFDPVRRRVLMFGGDYGQPDTKTWALELPAGRWRDLEAASPPQRFVGPMVYDPNHDIFIALADRLGAGPAVHVYHPADNRWQAMPEVTPRPRYGAIDAAFDPARNVVVVSGGVADWQPGTPAIRETWTYRYAPPPQPADRPLGPPRHLRTAVDENRIVRLRWHRPADGRAAGYRVLRADGPTLWNAKFEPVAGEPIDDTDWSDPEPLPAGVGQGGVRFYRVAAVDDAGQLGPPGEIVRTDPGRPASPTALLAEGGRVELTWPRSDEAAGYLVYRAEASSARALSFGPATQVTAEPLADTRWSQEVPALAERAAPDHPLPVYRYVVRAVSVAGVVSGPSPPALSLPNAPDTLAARRRGDGTVLLWWPRSQSPGLAGYFVLRADAGGDDAARANGSPIVAEAWIDRSATPEGFRRRYWVTPIDRAGQQGVPSPGAWSHGRP